jgi:hypothetical protein
MNPPKILNDEVGSILSTVSYIIMAVALHSNALN